jgi:hypothetical protein
MSLDPGEPFWVRLGRAPVHASRCQREARFSGPVTSLADFCNRIRRVGTPDERPILARERGFRSAAHRQVMPAALACPMRLHAWDGPRATTRAGHGSERPSEGKRAAFCERFRAPFLVELLAPGSSMRASCGTWSLPQTRRTDRDPRAMPLRESDSARRIKAPSAETELLREQRIAPPGAPEPRLRHAASAEALLGSAHAFLTGS